MKLALPAGTTSKKIQVVAEDSSSTTGAGLTGLVFNSGSLVAHYIRDGDASAGDITLVTATVGTWTSGGFKEIDSAKLPGLYEFGIPDALLASGADQVIIFIFGATNLVPIRIEIQLKPLPADLKQIDELATNGNNATLFLKQLSIINSAGTALIANSTGGNGDGIHATANGTGAGLHATGAAGAGSSGVKFDSSSSCLMKFAAGSQAILIDGGGADASQGIVIQTGSEAIKCKVDTTATAQTARVVIDATQAATNFDALKMLGMGTGAGIHSTGGATGPGALLTSAGSDGLQVTSTGGNGRGLFAAGNGTGAGINASGTSAAGAIFTSSASDGLQCTSSGSNGRGLFAAGNGTGAGIHGTSPAAAGALFTSAGSDGFQVTSTGGNGHGINASGNGTGHAFNLSGDGKLHGDLDGRILGTTINAFVGIGAEVDTRQFLGQPVLLDANNLPEVDVADWNGTAVGALVSPPTAAQVATAVWQDLLAGADFGTAGSIGALLKADVNAPIGNTVTTTHFDTIIGTPVASVSADIAEIEAETDGIAAIPTNPFTGTLSQITNAVWTDLTAGADFGVAGSIGLLLKTDIDATISSRMATFTLPTNFSLLSIDGSGRIDLGKWEGVAPNALIAGRVDADVSVVSDKNGYNLAATGLDLISTTPPVGIATTFREMVVQTWRRFFKRVTKNKSGDGAIKTYANDDTTAMTTQLFIEGSTEEEVESAT